MNNRIISSTRAVREITNLLINTLFLYIPLLAITHRQNYRGTNTLATHGLEELSSSCAVVSVFGSGGE